MTTPLAPSAPVETSAEKDPTSLGTPKHWKEVKDPYQVMPLPPDDSEGAKIYAENMREAYGCLVERDMGHMGLVTMIDGTDAEVFFPDTSQIRGIDLRRFEGALADVRPSAFDYQSAPGPHRPTDADVMGLNAAIGYAVEHTNGTTPKYVDQALVLAGLAGSNKIRAVRARTNGYH